MKYPLLIEMPTLLLLIVGLAVISFLAGADQQYKNQATKADKARIMAYSR